MTIIHTLASVRCRGSFAAAIMLAAAAANVSPFRAALAQTGAAVDRGAPRATNATTFSPSPNGGFAPAAVAPTMSSQMLTTTAAGQSTTSPQEPAAAANLPSNAQVLPFGSQLFTGAFAAERFTAFNGEYRLAIGDRLSLRIWGALNFEGPLVVDPMGNVFIPNVGPIRVLGVRNADLNELVRRHTAQVYKSNVGVYVALDAAQPVRVFVAGAVRKPGLYAGVSADSVLRFLDQAGGIDPDRGSYLQIELRRGDSLRATANLYDFVRAGRLDPVPLTDGDVIVVPPRRATVVVTGEVTTSARFEVARAPASLTEILSIAAPRPSATHARITRTKGGSRESRYHALTELADVTVQDGDEIAITADSLTQTILVSVDGNHASAHALVLPYGATLADAMLQIRPGRMSNLEAIQLYRKSVALRQREVLEQTLRALEAVTMNASSRTTEEAQLRLREAELIRPFIDRARQVQFKGQVVLAGDASRMFLEDGDVLRIPERSSVVMVHGDVLSSSAIAWRDGMRVADVVASAGGATRGENGARHVIIRSNGATTLAELDTPVRTGDDVLVLAKVDAKNVELVRGLTQIIYQLAVGARVLLRF